MPSVSIIIPVYNTAEYLSSCLDSVLAQTVTDWEAILVNDGSTDASRSIAESYIQKDPRFRLIEHDVNRGLSAARNTALSSATGEYIAFLDSDDWWENDFLERHIAEISGYDMVRSGYRRMNGTVEIRRKKPLHTWQFTIVCSGLFRHTSISGMHFEEGMYYEDVLWTVRFVIAGCRMKIIPYFGYNYRMHSAAITSTIHREDLKKLFGKLFSYWPHPMAIYTTIKMWLYTTF